MVGNIKSPIVVGRKLVIYEDDRIPARGVFPHEDVPRVDVIVRKHNRGVNSLKEAQEPVHFLPYVPVRQGCRVLPLLLRHFLRVDGQPVQVAPHRVRQPGGLLAHRHLEAVHQGK